MKWRIGGFGSIFYVRPSRFEQIRFDRVAKYFIGLFIVESERNPDLSMHEETDLVELYTMYTARNFSSVQPRTDPSKLPR